MPDFNGTSQSSPGGNIFSTPFPDRGGQIENTSYIPQLDQFLEGPDAQGNLTHRTWDPYDQAQPLSRLNLCSNLYFESIEEIFDGEGTPFDASMVRTYTRRFRVRTKLPTLGPSAVCSCPGVPMPYAPYVPGRGVEWDMYARAIRISAKREKAAENEFTPWIVEVFYSTAMPDGGPVPTSQIQLGWSNLGVQNRPWDEPPHLEWDPETQTTTPLADKDGKPFLNSAGQPIYPAPPVEEGVAVLVVTRNWRTNTLFQARQHIERMSYAVNSDPFVGGSRGQVLSLPPKAVEVYRGPLRFWRFTYRFKFKKGPAGWLGYLEHLFGTPDTWQPKMLDAGMYEIRHILGLPDPSKKLIPIFRGGVQVNQPVPLKNGRAADPTEAITADNWLRFRYYPETSFADIIPTTKL